MVWTGIMSYEPFTHALDFGRDGREIVVAIVTVAALRSSQCTTTAKGVDLTGLLGDIKED